MSTATASPPQHVEPGDLDTCISGLRSRIDDLDDKLVQLVKERQALSQQIQAARVAAGGVRIELSRESQVLAAYGRGLGAAGTPLATAVLRACRGSL